MNLFLDSSVLLSASYSSTGASREILTAATDRGWTLFTSPYVLSEVETNIPELGKTAADFWPRIQSQLELVDDVLAFDWITVFTSAKDRPVLFTAAANAQVLLTLDRRDFVNFLGASFYDLSIQTPGGFLKSIAGRD